MKHLILYCRAGFEGECAAEIQQCATEAGFPGFCRAQPRSGFVEFTPYEEGAAVRLAAGLDWRELVFARQLFPAVRIDGLPVADRITPLLALPTPEPVSGLWVETADTNEAKELLVFCRKFSKPLAAALERSGRLRPGNPKLPRLHLFFLDGTTAYVGLADPANSSPWFMGIPRLRFPRGAPSRSALKLEEAFWFFLGEQRDALLQPGMRAVDLGAAPGGWTALLVNRHIRVAAVDNGPMDAALMESGLVEHRREDGFRFRPAKPVDWLVCDMVEQPARIARLMADWLARGDCRQAIFNLKLPMKKRFAELEHCRELIRDQMERVGVPFALDLRQLYHDREEVTAWLRRLA